VQFCRGVQGGYNWQSANWVFGVEADIQGSSQRDNRACVLQCSTTGTPPLFVTYDATLPWFGTARARIGYLVGSTLFYGTAGYAYGSVKSSYHVQLGTENASPVFSETKGGWTAGAGIEAPFTFLDLLGPNWTAKAEYLYVDLGTATNTFIGQAIPVAFVDTTSTQVREHIFRSGLNYHFNSPVIAKY
jgi:outer membrane immunogenic protein